ncbi:hypothetical protein JW887_02505 [Candidatus Dojkabacteria bacterium]|nr:hypothetical protein [Candidatus Dojkabacteria bacterium]
MLSRQDVEHININKLKKVHFIGLLSPFSSFCATVLISKGVTVTASEYTQDDPNRKIWEDKGILYPGGHDASYISTDLDLVIFPNAPAPGNPECEMTDKLNVPAITVGQMTGLISRNYKTISIVGTHGKSTTSALIAWMIKEIDGLPSYIIGDSEDYISGMEKNWHVSTESEYMVIEACEYKRQFLDRTPNPFISVVTHIELDHTDYFKDLEDYNSAFVEFLNNTQNSIVIDLSGVNERFVNDQVVINNKSLSILDSSKYAEKVAKIKTMLSGDHNRLNMQKAYATGIALGFNEDEISASLASFPGMAKRFEFMGNTKKGTPVYRDFAHNPAKISACLQGAKEKYPDKKTILVFQPHSFERSFTFINEFAKSLDNADIVLVPNIFSPKRETEEQRAMISESNFVRILRESNPDKIIKYTQNFENTINEINNLDNGRDFVIVLASAGDLHNSVVPELVLK